MTTQDRALLTGAWLLMGTIGAYGVWKTRTASKEDPRLVAVEKAIQAKLKGPNFPPPPPVPDSSKAILCYVAVPSTAQSVDSHAGSLLTRMTKTVLPPPPTNVLVLPLAADLKAAVDLDGVTLTWTTQADYPVLLRYMIRTEAKPAGFVVRRQREDGPIEELQRLDAKARSYVDPTTDPNRTYRYWVTLTGRETDLADPKLELKDVAKGPDKPVAVRCPSATRVKVVGGDASRAIFLVEKYDRYKKEWVAKIAPAVPGAVIGASGWTLVGLKFDKFTIVAELKDENGVERVLSTKN